MVLPWYAGPAELAEKEFESILSLGPVLNMAGPTPYTKINAGSDIACIKNGYKRPCYSCLTSSPPSIATYKTLFRDWIDLANEHHDFVHGVVLAEYYGWKVASEKDDMSTAYPWRKAKVSLMAGVEYTKDELNKTAEKHGKQFKDTIMEGMIYVNHSSGDEEDLTTVYGSEERLERLRGLKRKWDPTGTFSFYNAIR